MDEKDLELLKQYKKSQMEFIKSIKHTENALLLLCRTIKAMALYDKWWLEQGYTHMRHAISAFVHAASIENDERVLQVLKDRQNGESNDSEPQNGRGDPNQKSS